jgi:hypothetical protein
MGSSHCCEQTYGLRAAVRCSARGLSFSLGDWKIRTIEKMNPAWADLYGEICR